MESVNFKISLYGNYCNSWPEISLSIGEFYKVYIVEQTVEIDLTLDLAQPTVLTCGLVNKSFGNNNVWDTTVDSNGNITNDKYIKINDFRLNDVSILNFLHKYVYQTNNESMYVYDNTLRFNGEWNIPLTVPVYNWIIMERKFLNYKDPDSADISYFSNYKNVHNDYDKQLVIIDKLDRILEQIK